MPGQVLPWLDSEEDFMAESIMAVGEHLGGIELIARQEVREAAVPS